jgi:hypothetical protein
MQIEQILNQVQLNLQEVKGETGFLKSTIEAKIEDLNKDFKSKQVHMDKISKEFKDI